MTRRLLGVFFGIAFVLLGTGCEKWLVEVESMRRPYDAYWHVGLLSEEYSNKPVVGACDGIYDFVVRGVAATDPRFWAVGSTVRATFTCASSEGEWCAGVPILDVDAVPPASWRLSDDSFEQLYTTQPGVSIIHAEKGGRRWGPLNLHSVEPDSLELSRLTLLGGEGRWDVVEDEPINRLLIAPGGSAWIVVRVLDADGYHLCGRPPLVAESDRTPVYVDTTYNRDMVGNGVVVVDAPGSDSTASVSLTVGGTHRDLPVEVVSLSAISEVVATISESLWVRFQAFIGDQEVAGTLFQLENLTPQLFWFMGNEGQNNLYTRHNSVQIGPVYNGASGTGSIRISVVDAPIEPVVFEFEFP